MIDIAVRMALPPMRVNSEIPHHVFVDFFLQINSDSPIAAYHFVGADSGVCGDVARRIWDANVIRRIAHRMLGSLDCRSCQP